MILTATHYVIHIYGTFYIVAISLQLLLLRVLVCVFTCGIGWYVATKAQHTPLPRRNNTNRSCFACTRVINSSTANAATTARNLVT